MGFDWLKNKRNQQKQIKFSFVEVRNKIWENNVRLHTMCWVYMYLVTNFLVAECVETWFEAAKSNDNGFVGKKASEWKKSLESF